MWKICSLNTLKIGESAEVLKLENTGSIRRRLLDLGVIEGNKISCVLKAPFNTPSAYLIKGAVVSIRDKDSKKIIVRCKNEWKNIDSSFRGKS